MAWAALAKQLIPAAAQIGTAFLARPDRNPARDIPTLQAQIDALERSRVYSEAAVNPQSPHFRALAALQEAEIKRNVLQAIQTLERSHARARARGTVGALVNPERRDEAVASTIADLFARSGDQARKGAGESLRAAAGQNVQQAGAFNPINQIYAAAADARVGDRAAIAETIQKTLFGQQNAPAGGLLERILGEMRRPPDVDLGFPDLGPTAGKTQFVNMF